MRQCLSKGKEAVSKYLWEYDDGVFNVWCKQCRTPKGLCRLYLFHQIIEVWVSCVYVVQGKHVLNEDFV